MALASKVRDEEMVVIDDLQFETPRTKDMASILKTLGCSSDSVLVTTADYDQNVYKSARNIEKVTVSPSQELNALSLLSAKRLLITKAALDGLKEKAASNGSPKGSE